MSSSNSDNVPEAKPSTLLDDEPRHPACSPEGMEAQTPTQDDLERGRSKQEKVINKQDPNLVCDEASKEKIAST